MENGEWQIWGEKGTLPGRRAQELKTGTNRNWEIDCDKNSYTAHLIYTVF